MVVCHILYLGSLPGQLCSLEFFAWTALLPEQLCSMDCSGPWTALLHGQLFSWTAYLPDCMYLCRNTICSSVMVPRVYILHPLLALQGEVRGCHQGFGEEAGGGKGEADSHAAGVPPGCRQGRAGTLARRGDG